jgi:hypothetical protein
MRLLLLLNVREGCDSFVSMILAFGIAFILSLRYSERRRRRRREIPFTFVCVVF